MFYKRLLQNYPVPTKMATSGFLFGLGDWICQKCSFFTRCLEETAQLSVTGCFYAAPVLHGWYCIGLPKVMSLFKPMNKIRNVLTMILLDQTAFATTFLCGFYITLNLMMKGSVNAGLEEINSKLVQTMKANWKIWPAAMAVNFSVVPMQYQVLFANCVGLVWNVILSNIANKAK